MLNDIIRPHQTGFLKGRSIIDNIFLAFKTMEWAIESAQPMNYLHPKNACLDTLLILLGVLGYANNSYTLRIYGTQTIKIRNQ
uniref:Uncharacterized protein n=1 Tax=Physcomitrium patens TaxID=3218 RepID=A0A2K1IZ97_PHYPA|nr:hypothetical protein PHYPA_024412 [Physcomitrium patens]